MVFQNIFYSYESLCLTFDFQLLEPVTLKQHSMKTLYSIFLDSWDFDLGCAFRCAAFSS